MLLRYFNTRRITLISHEFFFFFVCHTFAILNCRPGTRTKLMIDDWLYWLASLLKMSNDKQEKTHTNTQKTELCTWRPDHTQFAPRTIAMFSNPPNFYGMQKHVNLERIKPNKKHNQSIIVVVSKHIRYIDDTRYPDVWLHSVFSAHCRLSHCVDWMRWEGKKKRELSRKTLSANCTQINYAQQLEYGRCECKRWRIDGSSMQ